MILAKRPVSRHDLNQWRRRASAASTPQKENARGERAFSE
jgi:hypothetical protein